jgi:cell wall-associated NlpC family hydrolase
MDILAANKMLSCPKSDIKIVGHVIDTGVNPVGILANRVETVKYADLQGDTTRTLGGGRAYDYSDRYGTTGHGTGVAYLMCHDVPNMRIRSYNNQVGDTLKALQAVVEYVKAHPEERHIVNMSFKSGGSNELHNLIKQLVSLNVAVVVAAGNDGREAMDIYPSCYPEPITVAAVKNDGSKAQFSVWHGEVDFTDIGVNVLLLSKDGDMVRASGTSFSTPIVCNKLAKIWCGNPSLTEPELYAQAVKNTLDMGADGHDSFYGWGWIQSVKADKAITQPKPIDKIWAFIAWLNKQVGGIYVWGAQGEQASEAFIRRRETSTKNADRAIALYRKRKAEGMNPVYAYDCSGLGMKWLMDNKVLPKDLTAAGMYSLCTKITREELREGDMVFRYGLSGGRNKIHHVGYVVDGMNVIEAQGRDYGVVKRSLNAGGTRYWNRYGRLPFLNN